MTNTLAYRNTEFDLINFVANYAPSPYDDVHFYWYTKNRQWTNELQLASNSGGPLKWTVGVFYYNATDINHQPGIAGPAGPPFDFVTDSRIRTRAIAGYAQGSYNFTPATTLTLGARYSYEKRSVEGSFTHSAPFGFLDTVSTLEPVKKGSVSLRASLSQRFSPEVLIYASYNRGTKSGGFSPVQINNAPFGDEKLDAYEMGAKLELLGGRARLNLAGFYYKYGNIQLQSFKNSGPPTVYNAASATLYGLDAELSLRPTDRLTVNTSVGYVHSKFGDFPSAEFYGLCDAAHTTPTQCPVPGVGYYIYTANAKGFELPRAPKFTAALSVNYEIPVSFGKFDFNATESHNGGYYTMPSNQLRQKAFDRIGASIQYTTTDGSYYVRLWGANLTNSDDTQQLNFLQSGPIENLNSPRTYGLTIGAKIR